MSRGNSVSRSLPNPLSITDMRLFLTKNTCLKCLSLTIVERQRVMSLSISAAMERFLALWENCSNFALEFALKNEALGKTKKFLSKNTLYYIIVKKKNCTSFE